MLFRSTTETETVSRITFQIRLDISTSTFQIAQHSLHKSVTETYSWLVAPHYIDGHLVSRVDDLISHYARCGEQCVALCDLLRVFHAQMLEIIPTNKQIEWVKCGEIELR